MRNYESLESYEGGFVKHGDDTGLLIVIIAAMFVGMVLGLKIALSTALEKYVLWALYLCVPSWLIATFGLSNGTIFGCACWVQIVFVADLMAKE
jgi:hypothetical protein